MALKGKRRRSRVEDPEDPSAFGKRLREFRRSQRLTQAELAGDRYTAAYISQLESGRRQPTKESLVYIAERLGVSVEELSSGRGAGTSGNTRRIRGPVLISSTRIVGSRTTGPATSFATPMILGLRFSTKSSLPS
jgi:transcriptional regulator with XRE-family HTH domain